MTRRIARLTVAYTLAILFLSCADFSLEWRAAPDGSMPRTRGVGLAVGYLGAWGGVSPPAGLKARLHAPELGFAGATLVARAPDGWAFLITPWCALAVAWFAHVAWASTRRSRV
jgi:hypothetical protein